MAAPHEQVRAREAQHADHEVGERQEDEDERVTQHEDDDEGEATHEHQRQVEEEGGEELQLEAARQAGQQAAALGVGSPRRREQAYQVHVLEASTQAALSLRRLTT